MTKKELDKRSKLAQEISNKVIDLARMNDNKETCYALGLLRVIGLSLEMTIVRAMKVIQVQEETPDSEDQPHNPKT